jgi:hypothetical protein
LNPSFRDILFALSDENAEFLIVGAHALAYHGIPRSTGDLDILVRPTKDNAQRVWRALLRFGAPLTGLLVDDLSNPDVVFVLGREPWRIDILTDIDGVDFETAWTARSATMIEGRSIPVIGQEALLVNKRAAGRPKDLVDAQWLEAKRQKEAEPE